MPTRCLMECLEKPSTKMTCADLGGRTINPHVSVSLRDYKRIPILNGQVRRTESQYLLSSHRVHTQF
ncbi:hypothetical protein RchiOBHm_Chr5g0010371 [Rosa chinensis]|uniref:Uncharacterized protein n=1 Tax=Rosa chinensis TaxID=74649 RepID=A0A2P6Q4J9_ROSCH|nr:hypothetical protein RchiOBHm_Chr5g0010371 [Rosa chinensis]